MAAYRWNRSRQVGVLAALALVFTGVQTAQMLPAAATTPPPALGSECTSNDDTDHVVSKNRCIAELIRNSRGYLKASCVLDPKTLRRTNPLYKRGDCKGSTTGNRQPEAIAQARLLAWLNDNRVPEPSTGAGISPRVQWEVPFPKSGGKSGGRIDVMTYDRSPGDAPIDLVELKLASGGGETAAKKQLDDYVRDLPGGPNNRQRQRYVFNGYSDKFRLLYQDCGDPGVKTRIVYQYEVTSVDAAGVLVIKGPAKDPTPSTPCTPTPSPVPVDDPGAPAVPDVDDGYPAFPGPEDSDDAGPGIDFWEHYYANHPELEPLELDVPTSDVPRSPGLVSWETGADIALDALLAACKAHKACKVVDLVNTIVVENGKVLVRPILNKLGELLGETIGYRLYGDPHLATLDGFGYDLQSVGEFHLLELPEADIDVQARFVPAGPNGSQTQWIATVINDHNVEIGPGGIRIDGTALSLPSGKLHALGEGASLSNTGVGYALTWPGTGPRMSMIYNNLNGGAAGFLLPPGVDYGPVQGLLGDHDGDPKNDLALRDGTLLPANTSPLTLHTSFADSWRISGEESAFTYGPSESTATFTDLDAPANILNVSNLPADDVAAAHDVCAAAGVEPGPQFEDCVFDVALTGDTAYAESAALVTEVLIDATGKDFNAAGNLEVDFERSIPTNFVSPKYRGDAATTRMAGPLFDTAGYRFFVRDIGRHDGLDLEADLYAFGPVLGDSRAQSVTLTVNKTDRGQVLFDGGPARLSDGMAGTLTETGSGTLANGEQFTRYRLDTPLGRVGEALDVELTPENFKGAFTTSLGVDDIELDLDVPAAQRFDVTEPVVVGDAQIPGPGAGSARLESAGAADVYDFEVPAGEGGQKHLIKSFSCTAKLTYTLTRQDGAPVGRWPNVCTWDMETPQLGAGQYTLTVTSYASTAPSTYAFDMFAKSDPQQHAYTLGQVVRDGTPGPGAGKLENPAAADVYSFDAPAGRLHLDLRGSCPDGLRWILTGPAGGWVGEGPCQDRFIDPVPAGAYKFTVYTEGKRGGGTYGFQLASWPPPMHEFPVASFPFTVSDQAPGPGAGNLETQYSVDRYTFTVTDPAPLYLDWQTCPTTATGGGLRWQFIDENGEEAGESGTCADHSTAELPAGDYRLSVVSADQAIGDYAFQAWLEPLAPQTFQVTLPAHISPDQPGAGAGTLETKASKDVYTFTIPDDQSSVYLEGIDCAKPGMLTWALSSDTLAGGLEVNGSALVTVDSGTCEDKQIRRVAAGDYRLVVTAAGQNRGAYSLRITPSKTGTPKIVHAPPATAYNGQAIPIEAKTTCQDTEACFARLYYRTTKAGAGLSAGAWTRQNLTSTASTTADGQTLISWTGSVPATVVTTTGVDYFLTAGDGDDRNELPVAAPVHPSVSASGAGATTGGDLDSTYLHVTTVSPPLLAHVSPTYAHADTDLPLELKASCSTGTCTAKLHYRISAGVTGVKDLTGDPGWPTITMTQSATAALGDAGSLLTYKATIPADKVDTRGVDYYFEVTDTKTTSYWPGTTYQGHYAPTDGMRTAYQTIHVLEPPHIVHAPPATTGYRAATPITATANCPATRTCTARLYYRTTTNTSDPLADSVVGETVFAAGDFAHSPMTVTRLTTLTGSDVITITGSIPAAYADTRGIDYFFRVDDGSTTTWYPGTGQLQSYASIDGVRVAYHHIRVLDPPHIAHTPDLKTKALAPYTVTSRMTCATADCEMTLHWRNDLAPGEDDPGWHTTAMTRTGPPLATPLGAQYTYTATLPAAKVTTRGLAYYLEGFDGHVHDYSPGTGYWGAYLPLDGQHLDTTATAGANTAVVGAYLVRVLEPPHLLHAPPGLAEQGKPLTLTATSNCSSPTCPATLTWTDKDGAKQTTTMTAVKTVEGSAVNPAVPADVWTYTATIPAADTSTTVNYSISVTDGSTEDATLALQALVYQPAA